MTEQAAQTRSPGPSYEAFVEQSWYPYLRLATLLCGDPHSAEELLQDCLVRLYVRWQKVNRIGDPHGYLRRMLINGKVSRWRRTRREALVADVPDRAAPEVTSEYPGDLSQALRALSPQQRAVLVLRHYADMSEQQVATELGCSVGTVKAHHSRAMKRLRELLPHTPHSRLEIST